MDGAVAATGEDGVAAGGNRLASFLDGVMGRFRGNKIRFDAPMPEHGECGFQFLLALLAAAGVRVVKQRGLAHG